jgi:Ca2+-transporting ATPase
MRRQPRRLGEPLFGGQMILTGLVQGLGVLGIVLGVFAFVLGQGLGEFEARMLSFSTLVIADLGLIFSNRSRSRSILATLRTPNPALWWITGFTMVFLALAVSVPFLRGVFSFAPLHGWELVLVATTGLVSILVAESVKLRWLARLVPAGEKGKRAVV